MARRTLRIVIYSLLAGVLLVLLTMAALYLHTPGWYQPTRLSQKQLQEASGELFKLVSDLNNDALYTAKDTPFTCTITQEQLNRFMQALPLYDPRAKIPDELADPMIVLKKDRMILAGRVARLSSKPISLHLSLRVESERLAIVVESVDIGSLPLPKQFIRDQLAELRQRLAPAIDPTKSRGRRSADSTGPMGQLVLALFGAIDGEPMECLFKAPPQDHAVRLDKLALDDGKLTLTFVPLDEALPRLPDLPEN